MSELSKNYQIYATPRDRLKQFIYPRLRRLLRLPEAKYYRDFWALRDVSFRVEWGETVGIIGRNGSGKSTLLQMICGTLYPSAGEVEINGRVAALLELGSGFNPEFTGRENVFLYANVLGLSRDETQTRFGQIEAFAEIGDFIDRPVKTYSSGMMVRLAFAVIAHVDADILVIDEALAVGDAFFVQKCMRFLREFMQRGTILFVSHDTGAVRALCSRALWLESGSLMLDGEPKEVSERYLSTLFRLQSREAEILQDAAGKGSGPAPAVAGDQRQKFINASNLRNDLEVFSFDPERASYGAGGASITSVGLFDDSGRGLSWVVGGEQVTLRVRVAVRAALRAPIIGFGLKDRFGQTLFADNTYLSYRERPVRCDAGAELEADFTFRMPILPKGNYSIDVAVADGTQHDHVQQHWMHDALLLRSESSSVVTGLVGVPMLDIHLAISKPPA